MYDERGEILGQALAIVLFKSIDASEEVSRSDTSTATMSASDDRLYHAGWTRCRFTMRDKWAMLQRGIMRSSENNVRQRCED